MKEPTPLDKRLPDVIEKINKVHKERNVNLLPCSACGSQGTFTLMPGYSVQSLSPSGNAPQFGGSAIPLLPIVCGKCGNTIFFNALALGLGNDLFTDAPANGTT